MGFFSDLRELFTDVLTSPLGRGLATGACALLGPAAPGCVAAVNFGAEALSAAERARQNQAPQQPSTPTAPVSWVYRSGPWDIYEAAGTYYAQEHTPPTGNLARIYVWTGQTWMHV